MDYITSVLTFPIGIFGISVTRSNRRLPSSFLSFLAESIILLEPESVQVHFILTPTYLCEDDSARRVQGLTRVLVFVYSTGLSLRQLMWYSYAVHEHGTSSASFQTTSGFQVERHSSVKFSARTVDYVGAAYRGTCQCPTGT